MKKVSFNKGKNFFDVTNKNDKEMVMSRLNEKTWNALVEKMDSAVLMNGLESSTFVKPSDLNSKEGRCYMLSCYLEFANNDLIL